MKIKRLVSAVCALTVSLSCLAGMSVSVGAAANTGDATVTMGSWRQGYNNTGRVSTTSTQNEGYATISISHGSDNGSNRMGAYNGNACIGAQTGGGDQSKTTSGIMIGEQTVRFNANSGNDLIYVAVGEMHKDGGADYRGTYDLGRVTYNVANGKLTAKAGSGSDSITLPVDTWCKLTYVVKYSETAADVTLFVDTNTDGTADLTVNGSTGNCTMENFYASDIFVKNTFANNTSFDSKDEAIYTVGASDANVITISGDTAITKDQLEVKKPTFTQTVTHNSTDNIDISSDTKNTTWTVTGSNGNTVAGATIADGVLTLDSTFPIGETVLTVTATRTGTTASGSANITVTNNAAADTSLYKVSFTAKDNENDTDLTPTVQVYDVTGKEITDWKTTGLYVGTYNYTATLADYITATGEFTVESTGKPAEAQNVEFTMAEQKYTATIKTGLQYAIVTVAEGTSGTGKPVAAQTAHTDYKGEAKVTAYRGTYSYTVSKNNYNDKTDSVTIESNDSESQTSVTPSISGLLFWEDFEQTGLADRATLFGATGSEILSRLFGNAWNIGSTGNSNRTGSAYISPVIDASSVGAYKIAFDLSGIYISDTKKVGEWSNTINFVDTTGKVVFGLTMPLSVTQNADNTYTATSKGLIANAGANTASITDDAIGTIHIEAIIENGTVKVKAGDYDEVTLAQDAGTEAKISGVNFANNKLLFASIDNLMVAGPTANNTTVGGDNNDGLFTGNDGKQATAVLSEISTNGNAVSKVTWKYGTATKSAENVGASGDTTLYYGLILDWSTLNAATGTQPETFKVADITTVIE